MPAKKKKAVKKKTKKKKVNQSSAAASTPTRCERGEESVVYEIKVSMQDQVELTLTLCKSAFRVIAKYDNTPLFDQSDTEDYVRRIIPLRAGRRALHWGFLAYADEWQTKSEVLVNGIAYYRQKKHNKSNNPWNHMFLYIEAI